MVLKALIAAFALFTFHPTDIDEPVIPPTINLSAVRELFCVGDDGAWSGSGWLIGPHQMVTAFHVAEGKWKRMPKHEPICVDEETNTPVNAYKLDIDHDVALMTGPGLPTNMPYIKYTCARPRKEEVFTSYGITGYGQERDILRGNTLVATDKMSSALNPDDWVEGVPSPGMRIYNGENAPGSSGGPIVNSSGYAYSLNSAGGDGQMQNYDLADGILCKK